MPPSINKAVAIDWTIPIWGVLGLAAQAIAFVWLVATMSSQISSNSTRIEKLELHSVVTDTTINNMNAALSRIDERTRISSELAASKVR